MKTIEPNVSALLWFAAFWGMVSLGFYVLSGAFPLDTRPDLRRRPVGLALVAANVVLLIALAGGSLVYGWAHLRWTSLVIVVGLGVLFAPGLFNIWPERWRDGLTGLVIVLVGIGAMLAALGAVTDISNL